MPSSLIFAALALAWLVILVPMVARRRQDGVRTEDSAPTGRVVRSGRSTRRATGSWLGPRSGVEEAFAMPDAEVIGETDRDVPASDGRYRRYAEVDDRRRGAHGDEPDDVDLHRRRYRPGRGSFDPQAAAIAARAKYAFRQRVLLFASLVALASGLLAGFAIPVLWWAHGGVDLLIVGYLTYLRRQARIEEEVRRRRTARMASARRQQDTAAPAPVHAHPADERLESEPDQVPPPRAQLPGTVVVEADDDDPAFDHLDEPASATYRRAVGE